MVKGNMKTLYEILGVSRTATDEEIKKAYKRLAFECHPDSGGSEELFHQLNEAYKILLDKDKRERYDRGESKDSINKHLNDPCIDLLSNLFLECVNNLDVQYTDIFERMNQMINQNITIFNSNISKLENKIKKFKTAKERILKDNDGLFINLLNFSINNCELSINKLKEDILLGERSLKFLEECKYSPEMANLMINTGSFTTTGPIFTTGGRF